MWLVLNALADQPKWSTAPRSWQQFESIVYNLKFVGPLEFNLVAPMREQVKPRAGRVQLFSKFTTYAVGVVQFSVRVSQSSERIKVGGLKLDFRVLCQPTRWGGVQEISFRWKDWKPHTGLCYNYVFLSPAPHSERKGDYWIRHRLSVRTPKKHILCVVMPIHVLAYFTKTPLYYQGGGL